jgi:hypothetical protein
MPQIITAHNLFNQNEINQTLATYLAGQSQTSLKHSAPEEVRLNRKRQQQRRNETMVICTVAFYITM